MAIKTLNEQNMSSGKEEFLREAQVMVKLNHPCIVTLIGICQGPPLMLVCIVYTAWMVCTLLSESCYLAT